MPKLSLAVPNGSMEKQILAMLALVGISITKAARQFRVEVEHPLIGEVVFMRPQHMTALVAQGKYDLAICGRDLYEEYKFSRHKLSDEVRDAWCCQAGAFTGSKMELKPTKIVLFSHKDDAASSGRDVSVDEAVLSEYPQLTGSWFLEKRPMSPEDLDGPGEFFAAHGSMMKGNIILSHGGTEAHVPRDYRFGVCLTETGASLVANDLKIVEVVLETYPVLLTPSREFRGVPEKTKMIDRTVSMFKEVGLLV